MYDEAYIIWRMCKRKKKYTRKNAFKAAKKKKGRHYKCPHCEEYHLTSQK